MSKRLSGGTPVSMFTSHAEAAADNALSTVGRVSKVWQAEDGSGWFEGDIANTQQGRDLAALVVTDRPYLKNVSIRGAWASDPHKVTVDGKEAWTAPDLDVEGIDFTSRPGVLGAEVVGSLAEGRPENAFRIYESVDDLELIETTDGEIDVEEAGDAPGNGQLPYGNAATAKYADPGYQKDGKKRYPLNTAKRVRAAWGFINHPDNAAQYTSAQAKRIKSKIKSAAKGFGIDIAAETAAFQADLMEALEAYASTCIQNDDASIRVSGTSDPEALGALAQKISLAALAALNTLDPDEDGDIDGVTGPESEDEDEGATGPSTDRPAGVYPAETYMEPQPVLPGDNSQVAAQTALCAGCGGTLPGGAMYCPTCGQPIAQAESDETSPSPETEEAQVADTETPEASTEVSEGAPAAKTTYTLEDVLAAHAAGLSAGSGNAGPKNAKGKKASAKAPAAQGYENAPAEGATGTLEEGGETMSADATQAPAMFTTEQVEKAVKKAAKRAAEEAVRAAMAAVTTEASATAEPTQTVTEADLERIRSEALEQARKEAVEEYRTVGAGYRKGLVGGSPTTSTTESAAPASLDPRELAKMDRETFGHLAESVFENDRFFGPLIKEADRRAGRE